MSDFFVHPNGICESVDVGPRTRVWAFAHVLPGARIGADCNICDGVFIENDVVVGDRVTVKCGVQLWDGLRIESDVFIGPNATFTNDRFPRSKRRPPQFLTTLVKEGASIGANATILPGLEIGRGAMVGAGAVVTRSVPAFAIAVGNPATIVGYVDSVDKDDGGQDAGSDRARSTDVDVRGVQLHELLLVHDMRGELSVGEFERTVPFRPRRYFLVFDVPTREIRGEHAHKTCQQFLVCVKGTCSVVVDDGTRRQELLLDRPNLGLLIPAGIWATQYKYSRDAVLLVFASDFYDPADYIRSYGDYLRWIAERPPGDARAAE
jgi:acetyltransferase-like isoleucine patch superfamily enzyme